MRLRQTSAAAIAVGVMAAAPAAWAHPGHDPARVEAKGNPVTGGLAFQPAEVSVLVDDTVEWTNTDSFAPHTATEEHNLWDLAGDYGISPVGSNGFGPGETVERDFEAGTHRYFCRVHGRRQSGTVAVPPDAFVIASRHTVTQRVRRKGRRPKVRRRTVRRYDVVAIWASVRPADPDEKELVFDVERRNPGGQWAPWLVATDKLRSRFPAARGSRWEIRARLRDPDDAARATDWSPAVTVSAG